MYEKTSIIFDPVEVLPIRLPIRVIQWLKSKTTKGKSVAKIAAEIIIEEYFNNNPQDVSPSEPSSFSKGPEERPPEEKPQERQEMDIFDIDSVIAAIKKCYGRLPYSIHKDTLKADLAKCGFDKHDITIMIDLLLTEGIYTVDGQRLILAKEV
ncbi:MAG: hypothetical protein ACP6IU_13080 [Candidatus Asgardarchaeia archaeon]